MKSLAGLGVLFLIAFVLLGPFITIWALNTLFPALAIPFTLETYLAAMVLGGAVSYRGSK
jgi:hypothetical protein